MDVKFTLDNVHGWAWKWPMKYKWCYFCCCGQSGNSLGSWKSKFQGFLPFKKCQIFFWQTWKRPPHGRGLPQTFKGRGPSLLSDSRVLPSWFLDNTPMHLDQSRTLGCSAHIGAVIVSSRDFWEHCCAKWKLRRRWLLNNLCSWDSPGGPVVKTLPSNSGATSSIPGRGAKIHIPCAKKPKT